jgi:hypothetical protein
MSASLLNKPAHALDREGLPYMIIGGQAVLLYGEPRLTRDVDLTVAATPEEFDRVWRVVQEAQLQPLIEDPRSFVRQTWVLPTLDAESGLRVDFIFSWTPTNERPSPGPGRSRFSDIRFDSQPRRT